MPLDKAYRDKRKALLAEELRLIMEEESKEYNEQMVKEAQFALRYIDYLLELVPRHDCTSCNDDKVCNATKVRCRRCVFLKAKQEDYFPEDVKVTIYLNEEKFKQE
jgi:hypothetical protein